MTVKMRAGDLSLDGNRLYAKRVARSQEGAARKADIGDGFEAHAHAMLTRPTMDDQGRVLMYVPNQYEQSLTPGERYNPKQWTNMITTASTGQCTVVIGNGVTSARRPQYQLGHLLGIMSRGPTGFDGGGLAWVLFTEADAPTSGRLGHHDYQKYPMSGTMMANFCDQFPQFGTFYRSPPHGLHTMTGTGLRVLAYAPPPLADIHDLHEVARELRDAPEASEDTKTQMIEFLNGWAKTTAW